MPLSRELRSQLDSTCAHSIEQLIADCSADERAQLVEVIADPRAPDRRVDTAIHVVGRLAETDSVSAIAGRLRGMDERRLINAIAALGSIGNSRAETVVLRYRRNRSADVRRFVAGALAGFPGPRSRQALSDMASDDDVDFVRECAVQALRRG
ncbi:MAG: HEAT repeat domain-containing protein [Actinomycetota bacterium]